MADTTSIRLAEERDTEHLVNLFNSVFSGRCNRRIWDWKYGSNRDRDPSCIAVAEADEKIVGMYPALRVRMSLNGVPTTAFQPVDNAVLPPYRNGIAQKRMVEHYLLQSRRSSPLTFGFPGIRHFELGMKALGYDDLGELPTYQKTLRNHCSLRARIPNVAELGSLVDYEFSIDKLARIVADQFPISVLRDYRYLNHRYINNPQRTFRLLGMFDGIRLLGVVIASCDPGSDGTMTGTIYDIFGIDDQTVASNLLDSVETMLASEGVRVVKVWYRGIASYSKAIAAAGFERTAEEFFRPACLYPRDGSDRRVVLDPTSWLMTLGDSDL